MIIGRQDALKEREHPITTEALDRSATFINHTTKRCGKLKKMYHKDTCSLAVSSSSARGATAQSTAASTLGGDQSTTGERQRWAVISLPLALINACACVRVHVIYTYACMHARVCV